MVKVDLLLFSGSLLVTRYPPMVIVVCFHLLHVFDSFRICVGTTL